MTLERPASLPDFSNPPLAEVVCGVQFEEIPEYKNITSHGIWDAFRSDFPKVQEKSEIHPQFETFGGGQDGLPKKFQLQFIENTPALRFWLLSENENNLIQFQKDRFLQNWRKLDDDISAYPRFESIIERFEENLKNFQCAASKTFGDFSLSINQCEISYVNKISVSGEKPTARPIDFWSSEVFLKSKNVEGLDFRYSEPVFDIDNPIGRLHTSARSEINTDRSTTVRLELLVRGLPEDESIASAIDFLTRGRQLIVERFAMITSGEAQTEWERLQ